MWPTPPPRSSGTERCAAAGWTADRFFFYGTGGLAYGNVNLSSTFTTDGATVNASASSTRAGWVLSADVEYMVQPDLSLTLGYQYVDLGSIGLSATSPPATIVLSEVYVGVMTQEVALIHPDAVVRDGLDDYLRVDYARLGLHLMTLPEWQAQSEGARL